MNDINKFQELIAKTLELAKSQDNKINSSQIRDIFRDMEFEEVQREQIIEYLAANKINVVDYVKSPKAFEQKEMNDPIKDEEAYPSKEASEEEKSKDSAYLKQYLDDLKYIRESTGDEESQLLKQIKAGDKPARERFIEIQLKRVAGIACEYRNHGLNMEDLIQEGNIALIQSLDELPESDSYDAVMKFIDDYIRNSIMASLDDQQQNDRMENEIMEKTNRIYDAKKELEEELGRKPDIHEIAKHLEMPEEEIYYTLQLSADAIKLDDHHQHDEEE